MTHRYERYSLEINAIPIVRRETVVPVFADPSHGTGKAYLVLPAALAATAAGAHGLMVEVHTNPEKAKSDAEQQIKPDEFKILVEKCKEIHTITWERELYS